MQNRDREKKPNWVSLAVLLVILAPQVAIPIIVIIAVIATAKKMASSQEVTTANPQASTPAAKVDDCPKPVFCFHKDKGEHHVRKGKEMDPWDRPDIDIRKYQRRE